MPVELQLPIYISWDTLVEDDVLAAALEGIEMMAQFLPIPLTILQFGSGPWSAGDYGSVGWYKDRCRMSNGQLDGDMLFGLLRGEPWQEADPHYDFVLLGEDLNTRQQGEFINFVFGFAAGRISVQSFFRFILDSPNRQAALRNYRLLVAHEFGHVLGLVPGAENRHDGRGGIYHGHCTNLCVMQQVMSVNEVAQLDQRLRHNRILLCDQCLEYLSR